MALLQKDIRKLRPAPPPSIRRRESSNMESKTTTPQAAQLSQASAGQSALDLSKKQSRQKVRSGGESGYGSTTPSSPVAYWSEFETPAEEPYTVPVDESTVLLSLFRNRRQEDVERGTPSQRKPSFVTRVVKKISGIVESEMKASANGLTTLFYEKEERDLSSDDEDYNSEDSSEGLVTTETSHAPLLRSSRPRTRMSRIRLLNRGYYLCVAGCVLLLSLFGGVGFALNGTIAGIGFVLIGYLISISLEIVALVRFIMYFVPLGVC